MTTAFIEAKQLKLAIQRIPEQSEITLTVLIKCRTIAYYRENPIAASGMEALDTFVKLIKPILNQVDAQLTYQSKHCLNISGEEHTSWNYQLRFSFANITSVLSLLSLEAYHDVLKHFYAGADQFDTVVSY